MVGPKMSVKEQMQHVAAQNTFLPYDKIFFSSRWINIQARSAQGIQQLRPNRKHINIRHILAGFITILGTNIKYSNSFMSLIDSQMFWDITVELIIYALKMKSGCRLWMKCDATISLHTSCLITSP